MTVEIHHDEPDTYWRGAPCRTWTGRPIEYQMEARAIVEDRLDRSLPWHYAVPACGTKMCITDPHLVIHRAQKIAYPEGVCTYCGMPGYTKDHLLPVTTTGMATRKFVAIVPACHECNSAIGDRCGFRVTERREEAHRYLRKRHRKTLELGKRWSKNELNELGPTLRAHIKKALLKEEILLDRLAWPSDPGYDVRAFERSGYDDPIAMGLI